MNTQQAILGAMLFVLIALLVVAVYAVFLAGDDALVLPTAYPTLAPHGCDAYCLEATNISGTNAAIETAVAQTATAER